MKPLRKIQPGQTKALAYCRVSSDRQREEGHGLDSQEYRCRQYALAKGYHVEAVFPDDVSGGGDFMNRPGMVALLAYLDAHPHENYVVIFDDLKRYARDVEFHLKLRREMIARGATRECLNFNFEDSPEGKFFETIVAAQGELEREQNSRQVRQKQRACVESGYYIFAPVRGYKFVKREDGGKMLAPDPQTAHIVKEGLEGYASGRFQTAVELKKFFDQHPVMSGSQGGKGVAVQSVHNMLKNPLYAGRITIKKYGLKLHPGKHKPLISFETWRKIQDRCDGRSNAPMRKDLREDFPLRGAVCCADCDKPLSAAWSKGRSVYYAYYACYNKQCASYRKSIRKEKIEGEFETLLKDLRPTPSLFELARAMFTDLWDMRLRLLKNNTGDIKEELARIDRKIGRLAFRIVQTDNEAVIAAYEAEIEKLDEKRILLAEKAAKDGGAPMNFEESFRTAMDFLANPWKLWASDLFEHKRMVLRLAFSSRLCYCREGGFRTAGTAEPFRVLGLFDATKSKMVEGVGFEPTYAKRPDLQFRSFQFMSLRFKAFIKTALSVCHKVWKNNQHIFGLDALVSSAVSKSNNR